MRGIGLLVLSLIGALAPAPRDDSPGPDRLRAEYESRRQGIGRDAEAHARLAAWCGENGLGIERARHLATALLIDPSNPTARTLRDPVAAPDPVAADPARAANHVEYAGRVARLNPTADAHWALALWCESKGLRDLAAGHLAEVVRLDPRREAAWTRLGYRKVGGRWLTSDQEAIQKLDEKAQAAADRRWKKSLEQWRGWIAGEKAERREDAARSLAAVVDPRAVPSVLSVFAQKGPADQLRAVQLFGQIESPRATRALAVLSVAGKSPEVRRAAAESLRSRDPHDYADALIALLRDPIRYRVRPVDGPGRPGVLEVEGPDADGRIVYAPPSPAHIAAYGSGGTTAAIGISGSLGEPTRLPNKAVLVAFSTDGMPLYIDSDTPVLGKDGKPFHYGANFAGGHVPMGYINPPKNYLVHAPQVHVPLPKGTEKYIDPLFAADPDLGGTMLAELQREMNARWLAGETARLAMNAQARLQADITAIDGMNASTKSWNDRVSLALNAATGQMFGHSREDWTRWWKERQGYAYRPPGPRIKPRFLRAADIGYVPGGGPPILIGGYSSASGPLFCIILTHRVIPDPAGHPRKDFASHGASGDSAWSDYHFRGIEEDWTATPRNCFSVDTAVSTPAGPRPIGLIRPGDAVWTSDADGRPRIGRVSVVERTPDRPTLRLRVAGVAIDATSAHPIRRADRTWTRAGDLRPGDRVALADGPAPVEAIDAGPTCEVVNILIDGGSRFLVGSARLVVHDGSPVDD